MSSLPSKLITRKLTGQRFYEMKPDMLRYAIYLQVAEDSRDEDGSLVRTSRLVSAMGLNGGSKAGGHDQLDLYFADGSPAVTLNPDDVIEIQVLDLRPEGAT